MGRLNSMAVRLVSGPPSSSASPSGSIPDTASWQIPRSVVAARRSYDPETQVRPLAGEPAT